jgi:hypothetical protein
MPPRFRPSDPHRFLSLGELRQRHPNETIAQLQTRAQENETERYRAGWVRRILAGYRSNAGDFRPQREILREWRQRGIAVPRFYRHARDADGKRILVRIPLRDFTPAERRYMTEVVGRSSEYLSRHGEDIS